MSVDLQEAINKDDKIIEEYEKNAFGEMEVTAIEVDTTTKYDKVDEIEEEPKEEPKGATKGKRKAKTDKDEGLSEEVETLDDLFFDTGDY